MNIKFNALQDILPNDMQVARSPIRRYLVTILTLIPLTSWRRRHPRIPDAREVRTQRVQPNVHRLRVVIRHGRVGALRRERGELGTV